ncbi:MAG: glycosyltransferase family 4 protein [Robiginitomaculum sp.]|nr:glycosyltransferase family 4 protein [Robiginitomaculum sp.]
MSKKPKIFQGLHNIAGAPTMFAKGLRASGYDATSVCYGTGSFDFPVDIPLKNDSDAQRKQQGKKLFLQALRDYDLFHFHFGESLLGANLKDVKWLKLFGKKVFFHFHGCDLRDSKVMHSYPYSGCLNCWPVACSANRDHAVNIARKYADGIFVSTPDLIEFMPEAELVLQPMDPIYLQDIVKKAPDLVWPTPSKPIRIFHAPSHRQMKGTSYLIEAVKQLKKKYKITLEIAEGIPNAEILKKFGKAHIVVDQLLAGSYGTFTAEAMASARPVITYVREDLFSKYPKKPPILSAHIDNITEVLESAIKNKTKTLKMAKAGQKYVLKHHSATAITNQLITAYGLDNASFDDN